MQENKRLLTWFKEKVGIDAMHASEYAAGLNAEGIRSPGGLSLEMGKNPDLLKGFVNRIEDLDAIREKLPPPNNLEILGLDAKPPPSPKGATLETDNTAYSTAAQIAWLSVWFVNNIGITLVNKVAFAGVDFRYPATLSAVHMLCNTVGAHAYMHFQSMPMKSLGARGNRTMALFSLIFAANIVVGNASLRYVSVNFNQVMRSLVPAMVMAANLLQGKTFSRSKTCSVVPIVAGVMLATFGDMRYSAFGILVTIFCVVLAAMKAVLSGSMLTGEYKLDAFDLLSRMAPLSFCWMAYCAYASGEVDDILSRWEELQGGHAWHVVWLSGLMSFSLNITSFMANKVTSPLTLTVASNVKQVLLIAVATVIFATPISWLNGIGILIVILGSARYSTVTVREKIAAQGAGK